MFLIRYIFFREALLLLLPVFFGALNGQDLMQHEKATSIWLQPEKMRTDRSVIIPDSMLFNYDVFFYKLDLEVYDTTALFHGYAETGAQIIVNGCDTFLLECSDKLTVDSVYVNGAVRDHMHGQNRLKVVLDPPADSSDVLFVRVHYHTPPGYSSTYFSSVQDPDYGDFRVTQSMSEPYFAHEWFPCKQELTDKADSVHVFVTTDSSLKVASNGLPEIISLPQGKTRWEWKTRHSTAHYLISLAVSDYQEYNLYAHPAALNGDSILIQNMLYDHPGCLSQNAPHIDKTIGMLELFSDLFGLYPFYDEKYGHYMWHTIFAGMEHITMSGMNYFNEPLISHELAHSWFGNSVTCATWSDIWINEGFASYAQYLQKQYLVSQYAADLVMDFFHNYVLSQPGGSVYVPENELTNWGRIFSNRLSYKKGAAIIHQMRFEMDDDSLFFGCLRQFLTHYRDSIATGMDFRQVCEDITSQDWIVFFDQWYFGEGFPMFEVYWSQEEDTLRLEVHQQGSTTVTPFFKTPVEYRIIHNLGDTIVRVDQTDTLNNFNFIIPGEATAVEVDPHNWILNTDTVIHRKNLDLKVYLEGPFDPNNQQMSTHLNPVHLPVNQPFNIHPWFYGGDEQVTSFDDPDIVDWILVELRETPYSADSATSEVRLTRKAGLLMSDGAIISAEEFSAIEFNEKVQYNLYAVIWHRNHLGILSAEPLSYSKGSYSYDFTAGPTRVYGGALGYSELLAGIWGMASGDGLADGQVNNQDKNDVWAVQSGLSGYLPGDFNMDSEVNNQDKVDQWLPNSGKGSQVVEIAKQ